MTWFNVLLTSTISTTRYLNDHYSDVEFRVVGQEERNGKIYRISEFIIGDRMIVHSTVEIDVTRNPPRFIEMMRGQIIPIGDVLRDEGYRVERKILSHDAESKVYTMEGDVNLKITEKYYDM
jgi:hypothetical protein